MSFVPFDNLIVASQVLYDARISELRHENEELRVKVFWLESDLDLNLESIISMHYGYTETRCGCGSCLVYRGGWPLTNGECKWKPLFEEVLDKFKLTHSPEDSSETTFLGMIWSGVDSHLCSGIGGNWGDPGYGKKFQTLDLKVLKILVNFKEYIKEEYKKWLH